MVYKMLETDAMPCKVVERLSLGRTRGPTDENSFNTDSHAIGGAAAQTINQPHHHEPRRE
jgi:hypothetical protein